MSLSPGQWHNQVPRDLKANLQFRLANLKAIGTNKALQKGCMEVCRQDIVFWINSFCCQFNPNSIGQGSIELGPFITWDFQDTALISQDPDEPGLLWCIDNREDVLILKSREMGASWLCLLVILWLFLFHPWKKILVISRSAAAVDEPGDSDSLFWKLDFILEHLPDWMKGSIKRRKFSFVHEGTRSAITGQASTGAAGVGGRGQLTFLDEFPMVKEDFEMLTKTASTSGSRIFNGTHNGTDTAFYKLADPRGPVGSYIKRLTMHWTQHPDKVRGLYKFNRVTQLVDVLDKAYEFPPDFKFVMDGSPTGGVKPGQRSPWYDNQVHKIGSTRGAAEELDIDAQGAAAQFFDQLRISDLVNRFAIPPLWEGELDYDRDLALPRKLVKQDGGRIKLWIIPDHEGRVPKSRYAMGADVSAGTGATPSCLSIGDANLCEKVMEYSNPFIEPKDLAALGVALCRWFADEHGNGALWAWEIPGPGQVLGDRVIELGYRNVHFRGSEHDLITKVYTIPGWPANSRNIRDLLEDYKHALYRMEVLNRSTAALSQTLDFKYTASGLVEHGNIKSPDDPSGARVNHGDLVIADALMYKMLVKLGATGRKKIVDPLPLGSLLWRRSLRRQREMEEAWN